MQQPQQSNPQPQPPSLLSLILRSPLYLLEYFGGFVVASITDITTTSLLIGSIAVGLATNVYAGIAVFFLSHVGIKVANAVNGAIIQNARATAQGARTLASVFSNRQPEPPQEKSSE